MKINKQTIADVFPPGPPLSAKEAALRGRWYTVAGAAAKLDCSTSSIERRAVEWQDEPVPFRFRYLLLVWDQGGEPERRYLAGLYKLAAAKRENSSAECGWNAIWVCMS